MAAEDFEAPRRWLARCLGSEAISFKSAYQIGKGSGCRGRECGLAGEIMVLNLRSPGSDDYTHVGPVRAGQVESAAPRRPFSWPERAERLFPSRRSLCPFRCG
jgi:hypothetical protein